MVYLWLLHINSLSEDKRSFFVIGSIPESNMLKKKDANVFIFMSDQCTVNKLAKVCASVVDIVSF